MWRAMGKGAVQAALGNLPGGPHAYRVLTRELLGTQATHVDKLARVMPAYAALWNRVGVTLTDARIWFHEGGHTPYPLLAAFLLTGRGGLITNSEARISDRYLTRAVHGVLGTAWPEGAVPPARAAVLEALRFAHTIREVLTTTHGELWEGVDPRAIPLPAESADLCHSGGALEHYSEDRLRGFLRECLRVLRPGGVASHVFDHRDHLWHADRGWPFLAHLAWPEPMYRALFGHPLTFHNRLSPARVAALFEEAGFEKILHRRLIVPGLRWVEGEEILRGQPGISRRHLRRQFREMSDADLRSAAVHYLYRRPIARPR
jgi:SAM-dependent methyltransferase